MDTLRGTFESGEPSDDSEGWDARDEGTVRELPPEAIGQDERRMQVRAYNHWAGLLGERNFPSIEDLEPEDLPDFGPNSVLLDFSAGIEDPVVQFLGDKLGEECGGGQPINRLSDVPPRSLLSRITDHYMQILANQAPIGFEAEFVNQRGHSVLYRGILLPYSSDDDTIDFIYGVINWKEMADQVTADELLLEIDQAIEGDLDDDQPVEDEDQPHKHHTDRVTDWADSPAQDLGEFGDGDGDDNVTPLTEALPEPLGLSPEDEVDDNAMPLPDFGQYDLDDPEEEEDGEDNDSSYSFASLSDYIEAPSKKALDLDGAELDASDYEVDYSSGEGAPVEEVPAVDDPVAEYVEDDLDPIADTLPSDAGLYDCLASARELAQSARASEDRSRQALYAAVGRAYDVSLAAQEEPEEYNELIEESGLTVQERAPMTPVVKLVFGSDYDKTRLTEYAAVLSHAHRIGLERGSLADYLGNADGGLKGVVTAERRLRREEAGKQVEPEDAVRHALAKKLRELEALTFDAIAADGAEFSLVVVRRDGEGNVAMLGEIDDDVALIERAARKLVG